MKLETSPKVTKSKRSLHWCRSISKKYLCRFYYSISQKVITLSGRRFITVSGVLLHYRAVITLSGVFYYIIGQLLQYQAFITLSVGTQATNLFTLGCVWGDAPSKKARERLPITDSVDQHRSNYQLRVPGANFFYVKGSHRPRPLTRLRRSLIDKTPPITLIRTRRMRIDEFV